MPYVASDGTHINGLRRRRHDGRWILADSRTFTEPDEQKAIERFRRMTDPWPAELGQKPSTENSPVSVLLRSFQFVGGTIGGKSPEERFWQYVAEQIRQRPRIGGSTDRHRATRLLQRTEAPPLPALSELETVWQRHARITPADTSVCRGRLD